MRQWCLQDHEMPSRYQKLLWVIFQFAASRRLVLDSPGSIDVRTPIVDSQRPGGIGLEELEGFLLPTDIRLGDSAPLKSWASSLSEAGRVSTRTIKVEIRMYRGRGMHGHSPTPKDLLLRSIQMNFHSKAIPSPPCESLSHNARSSGTKNLRTVS